MKPSNEEIQKRLTEFDPEIDLLALEQPGKEALRLFIDHPAGVDLALCERVTHHLSDLLVDYSLEVSSPGPKHRRKHQLTEAKGVAAGQGDHKEPS